VDAKRKAQATAYTAARVGESHQRLTCIADRLAWTKRDIT
jgi:hypothetical protein